MVKSLAGQIEKYLKELLEFQDFIELQRSELAGIFRCVPSQINYVLSTRFTPNQGYIVESRRGGGGYLRIVKLSWEDLSADSMEAFPVLEEEGIGQGEAEGILQRLQEEHILTDREFLLLRAILDRQALGGSRHDQDRLRARLLLTAVNTVFRLDAQ
ncbi:MAG: CtsR family transcriptional regulator [Clostridiales bacterium]|nr:CtsR family transcriptional regulator [Clostridiales bacterium]